MCEFTQQPLWHNTSLYFHNNTNWWRYYTLIRHTWLSASQTENTNCRTRNSRNKGKDIGYGPIYGFWIPVKYIWSPICINLKSHICNIKYLWKFMKFNNSWQVKIKSKYCQYKGCLKYSIFKIETFYSSNATWQSMF